MTTAQRKAAERFLYYVQAAEGNLLDSWTEQVHTRPP